MRTKLLFLMLCICTLSYAQYPTNGLISAYEFNGNLVDQASGSSLTPTGSMLYANDRFNNPGKASNLLFGSASRGDVQFPDSGISNSFKDNLSYSFWVKTALNVTDRRVIIEDSDRSSDSDTDWLGYYFYLQDGKIKTRYRMEHTGGAYESGATASPFIADGEWHHVVITMFYGYHSSGTVILTSIYIDGQAYDSNSVLGTSPSNITTSYDTVGDISIGNNRTHDLPAQNKYPNTIDDILIYNRVITQAEVQTIKDHGNFCFVPDSSILSATTINNNDVTVAISETGTFDIAYVKVSEPFSNATIVTGVSSGSVQITSLEPNTDYDVYVREDCAITSSWSATALRFTTTRTIGTLYVNENATGLNNGTSWIDAYTNLQDALAAVTPNEAIWIASGTYKPTVNGGDRTATFNVTDFNVKLYGGFVGTETNLSERVFGANETVLSGDLNNNDAIVPVFGDTTRDDNSYHVISSQSTLLLDRLTITGGNANASGHNSGAAILKNVVSRGLTIRECKISNNTAGSNIISSSFASSGGNAVFNVTNSIIENNVSRVGTLYSVSDGVVNSVISNTLFKGNKTEDNTVGTGTAGSSLFFRTLSGTNSNMATIISNCTFVDNEDIGTTSGYNNFNRSTVVLSNTVNVPGNRPKSQGYVYNSIFYNNITLAGITGKSINGGNQTLATMTVSNCIDQDNFSQITASNVSSSSNANPQFVNAAGGNYELLSSSPAIDGGEPTLVNGITDLLNNPRIINTNPDMGVYEYIGTCGDFFRSELIPSDTVATDGTFTWEHPSGATEYDILYVQAGQPGGALINVPSGSTDMLVINGLVPGTIYDIYIRAYCNGAPSAYTKFTLGFRNIIHVKHNATGDNTGLSWANAFTSLEMALASSYNGSEIWIADGIYKPAGSDRDTTFLLEKDDLKIYGGFNGTETDINDRDLATNESILSGDLNGDDIGVSFTGNNRSENLYHVVTIGGNRITIDGLVIEGGQADATTGDERFGAGIFWQSPIQQGQFVIENSKLRNNVAVGGAGVFSRYAAGAGGGASINFIKILNCNFSNNIATYGAGVYTINVSSRYGVTIANCLFYSNTTMDRGTDLGFTGSSAWVRANSAASSVTSNFYNNTFVNNLDIGTSASTERGTLSVSKNAQFQTTHQARFSNNILYNNRGVSNTVTKAITRGHTTIANNIFVKNSIDEDNFSNIASNLKVNTSNADPLFNNVASNDYTLGIGSPAIDTGENADVEGTTDILGNQRIFNVIVDMGAYEYSTALLLSPKAFLQGAMLSSGSSIMRDDLRVGNNLSITSPYADAATCNSSVFTVTGNDAIVDWILVELRDSTTNTTVVDSQSALIQRDGDIVAIDGVSPMVFNVPNGNYYVVIKHRSHLGIMTANTVSLGQMATVVDFTNANAPITFGTNAQTTFGMPSGLTGMWAGDTNGDGKLNYLGAQSDVPSIRSQVFNDPANSIFGGPPVATYGSLGYYATDINMDGVTYYSGGTSDVLQVRNNIFNNPSNSVFGGPPVSTYTFIQQLPEGANN